MQQVCKHRGGKAKPGGRWHHSLGIRSLTIYKRCPEPIHACIPALPCTVGLSPFRLLPPVISLLWLTVTWILSEPLSPLSCFCHNYEKGDQNTAIHRKQSQIVEGVPEDVTITRSFCLEKDLSVSPVSLVYASSTLPLQTHPILLCLCFVFLSAHPFVTLRIDV